MFISYRRAHARTHTHKLYVLYAQQKINTGLESPKADVGSLSPLTYFLVCLKTSSVSFCVPSFLIMQHVCLKAKYYEH